MHGLRTFETARFREGVSHSICTVLAARLMALEIVKAFAMFSKG